MALNLTPCVYPLLPITVSYFGGKSGQGQGRLLAHGLFYLVGLALTNSTLGVAAALTGGLMGAMLQNPVVLLAVAAILVFFATSLFGFGKLRLPGSLTQAASKSYAGYFGSLFMGLTLGLVAAPCIGPFVLGLLTWVASRWARPCWVFWSFLPSAWGWACPCSSWPCFPAAWRNSPASGEWMLWVRQVMGLGPAWHGGLFYQTFCCLNP